jgi:hypothetical protein
VKYGTWTLCGYARHPCPSPPLDRPQLLDSQTTFDMRINKA